MVCKFRICGDGKIAEMIEYSGGHEKYGKNIMSMCMDFVNCFSYSVLYWYDTSKLYLPSKEGYQEIVLWNHLRVLTSLRGETEWAERFGFKLSRLTSWSHSKWEGSGMRSQNPTKHRKYIEELRQWKISNIQEWLLPK
eukprot:UN26526